jgi:hypothetical protein
MEARYRFRGEAGAVLLIATLTLNATVTAVQEPTQYVGMSLGDALRVLQGRGLRIVFTSAAVTPDLRVRVEPKRRTPRQQLEELLAPHGLVARDGPGGTIQIVRGQPVVVPSRPAATGTIGGSIVHAFTAVPLAGVIVRVDGTTHESRTDAAGRFLLRHIEAGRRIVRVSSDGYLLATRAVDVTRGATATVTVKLAPVVSTHSEHVTVNGPRPHRTDRGVSSESSLGRTQVERMYGSLADDPIRAAHALPRVSTVDEFRSEFTVRGSPFRHVDLVIDGVSTQWLQHTAYGRGATGSLGMLAAPVLESVALQAGAYPRRRGDRLGPQLELTLREGSREHVELRGMVGGTNAMLLGEGPLGQSGRGSWLVAARQSFLEWPTERPESRRTAFGFSDAVGKLVYDVRPSQQVSVSVLSGISNIDGGDDLAPDVLGDGTNRASLVNVSWRSTFGSSLLLTQRASLVTQRFLNRYQTGRDGDRGANQEVAYRADVARPLGRGLLDAGVQVGRSAMDGTPPSGLDKRFAAASWVRSGYAHFAWKAAPNLTLSPGLRVTDSSLLGRPVVTRWLLAEWGFRQAWTLNASAGVSHQLPDLHQLTGEALSADFVAERATHLDVGIEQRPTQRLRWQATFFARRENNVLREPDLYPRLLGNVPTAPGPGGYVNALRGAFEGVELLIDRYSATGLSGWASYSYGGSRYTDTERLQTFWADFDQRHAFNLFAAYRFANGASLGGTYRAGSNFPLPGYFARRNGGLFVGDRRNQVRLPVYARLDLRGDFGFDYLGRHLTVFGEVLNVLNRGNAGRANGTVNPLTGEATGFIDMLFRRRASAGIVIEF